MSGPRQRAPWAAIALAVALLAACRTAARAQRVTGPRLPAVQVASRHAMKYYVSPPVGWNGQREWPILVALEGTGRDYDVEHQSFLAARGDRPYILVTPLIVSNRGRDLQPSPYPPSVVTSATGPAFDRDGITAVLHDVRRRYRGTAKVYVTGFSAGGHAAWMLAFTRPEMLAGVALGAGNYAGRGIDRWSSASERATLPIRDFIGTDDPGRERLLGQWAEAKRLAEARGYTNLTLASVANVGHDRFASQVLAWVDSLEAQKAPRQPPR